MDYFNQESERLLFRKLTAKDAITWLAFFIDNDRLHFLGLDLSKDHKTLSKEWIEKQMERYINHNFGLLAVIEKSTGKLIGMGGILPRDIEGVSYFEIAYSLMPTHWNKGYGTEIAKKMRSFGEKSQLAAQFISVIHKENIDSMHVAVKNGMTPLKESLFNEMEVIIYSTL
jgi:[ribosomal protein S5]-alanine N-acetyltransferase